MTLVLQGERGMCSKVDTISMDRFKTFVRPIENRRVRRCLRWASVSYVMNKARKMMKQNQMPNSRQSKTSRRKHWLLVAAIVGLLTTAFAAVALQGKISLDSPVSFPVDI